MTTMMFSQTNTQSNMASGEFSKSKTSKKRSKIPEYLTKMNAIDKAMNNKIIQRMETQISYLRNPRFRVNRPPLTFLDDVKGEPNNPKDPFRIDPQVVTFTDYQVDAVYEIPLTVTNASAISRRLKYMPPATVKYPLDNGQIAPGMSAVFYVNFFATSLSDYDDHFVIISEESSFKVRLQARKEHPKLTLSPVLDCQSCWLGDRIDMVFQFTNKGGEGGFKFFCESEEDDQHQQGEVLKLRNFTVYPSEFYIGKNENMELFVVFTPQQEGIISEKVILACDNNTSAFYTINARANMVELKVAKLNGAEIDSNLTIDRIFFPEVSPNIERKSILNIRNNAGVKVNYSWSIDKDEDLDENEPSHFSIDPQKGFFQGDSEIDFTMTFSSNRAIPHYQKIKLLIEDIPFQSIRNPPDIIKKQFEDHKTQDNGNTLRPSITYFEFPLVGIVKLNEVETSPPYYKFPKALIINNYHSKMFTLKNKSTSRVPFNIELKSKSSDEFDVTVFPDSGTIEPESDMNINVRLKHPSPLKEQNAVFLVYLENAHAQSFEISADFVGPEIKILQPEISFGLVKSQTKTVQHIQIQNISDVEAKILLKKEYEEVSFMDFETEDPEERYYQWWNDKLYFETQYLIIPPFENVDVKLTLNATLPESIHTLVEVLLENGSKHTLFVNAEVQDIHVGLNRSLVEYEVIYADQNYDIRPRNSRNISLINFGNLPAHFKWTPIEREDLIVNFEPQEGIVLPHMEIPIVCKFIAHWGEALNEVLICDIEDVGPIGIELKAPIEGLSIAYELVEEGYGLNGSLNKTGTMNGSRGLNASKGLGLGMELVLPGSKFNSSGLGSDRRGSTMALEALRPVVVPLEKIELLDMVINTPKEFRFLIKNTSGIETNFTFFMEHFEPVQYKDDINVIVSHKKGNLNSTHLSGTHSTMKGSQRPTTIKFAEGTQDYHRKKGKTGHLGDMMQTKPDTQMLGEEHEKLYNFTSATGQDLNKTRRMEKDSKFYLTNNKGIAVVCQPKSGTLHAHEEIMVNLTAYNDTCGVFEDYLCCDVKGLSVKKFPIRLNVTGSPLVVTPNQVGVDFKNDYPSLTVGHLMHSFPAISKQFKLTNSGPDDLVLEWKIHNLNEIEADKDFFDLKIAKPDLGSTDIAKVSFEPVEPEVAQDGPFQIIPQRTVVQGRKQQTFTVSFSQKVVGAYNAVIIGRPQIVEKGEQSHPKSFEILPVYLKAFTESPFLTLDKRKEMDNSHCLRFEKWSLHKANKQEKNIILRNKTSSNLFFNVQVDGPFTLLQTKTTSPAKYEHPGKSFSGDVKVETHFNLTPASNVDLLVRFDGYPEKEHEQWPLCPSLRLGGVIHINYANQDYQSFDMEGILLRPILKLNTEGFQGLPNENVLDFGTVHINNVKTLTVFLVNESKVPGKWKLNYLKYPVKKLLGMNTMTAMEFEDTKKMDDSAVWEFSITEGVQEGPTLPVNKVPTGAGFDPYGTGLAFAQSRISDLAVTMRERAKVEPKKILINFRPKKNILYKSKFRIMVEEAPSIELILKGHGTYDENLQE